MNGDGPMAKDNLNKQRMNELAQRRHLSREAARLQKIADQPYRTPRKGPEAERARQQHYEEQKAERRRQHRNAILEAQRAAREGTAKIATLHLQAQVEAKRLEIAKRDAAEAEVIDATFDLTEHDDNG